MVAVDSWMNRDDRGIYAQVLVTQQLIHVVSLYHFENLSKIFRIHDQDKEILYETNLMVYIMTYEVFEIPKPLTE